MEDSDYCLQTRAVILENVTLKNVPTGSIRYQDKLATKCLASSNLEALFSVVNADTYTSVFVSFSK